MDSSFHMDRLGSAIVQNSNGVVQFELVGWHAVDRPSAAYLEKMMKAVL